MAWNPILTYFNDFGFSALQHETGNTTLEFASNNCFWNYFRQCNTCACHSPWRKRARTGQIPLSEASKTGFGGGACIQKVVGEFILYFTILFALPQKESSKKESSKRSDEKSDRSVRKGDRKVTKTEKKKVIELLCRTPFVAP